MSKAILFLLLASTALAHQEIEYTPGGGGSTPGWNTVVCNKATNDWIEEHCILFHGIDHTPILSECDYSSAVHDACEHEDSTGIWLPPYLDSDRERMIPGTCGQFFSWKSLGPEE